MKTFATLFAAALFALIAIATPVTAEELPEHDSLVLPTLMLLDLDAFMAVAVEAEEEAEAPATESFVKFEALIGARRYDSLEEEFRWVGVFADLQFNERFGGQLAYDFASEANNGRFDPANDNVKRFRLFYTHPTRVGNLKVDVGRQLTRNPFGHDSLFALELPRWPITNEEYTGVSDGVTFTLSRGKHSTSLALFEEAQWMASYEFKGEEEVYFLWWDEELGSGFTWRRERLNRWWSPYAGLDYVYAGSDHGWRSFLQNKVRLRENLDLVLQVDAIGNSGDVYPLTGLAWGFHKNSWLKVYYDWAPDGEGSDAGWKVEATRWVPISKIGFGAPPSLPE